MEINFIQNYYRLQNSMNSGRVKRTTEETSSSAIEKNETDKIAISSEASFKAQLSAYARVYDSQNKQAVSKNRIEELKAEYANDNCPVSGHDIATAVLKYTLGLKEQE